MFDMIQKCNPDLEIRRVWDDEFTRYGRIVSSRMLGNALELMMKSIQTPKQGSFYVPRADLFASDQWRDAISGEFFGEMAVEIGYCAGHNDRLTALEYHKCSEVLAFSADVVILLGRMEDIDLLGGIYEVDKLEAFYISAGSQIELYPGTLHYGALETEKSGFQFIVCLLDGTNTALDQRAQGRENEMLIQKNKWVLCNRHALEEMEAGAPAWIVGRDIQIDCPVPEASL